MAEVLEQLNAARLKAMKNKIAAVGENRDEAELQKNAVRLNVVRGLIGEIERDSKDKKPRGGVAILKSERSKRLETAKIYDGASEPARRDVELAEAEIVAEFLPKEPTEQELKDFIAAHIEAHELTGPRAMGELMKALRSEFENFDGKAASALAKELLG